VKIGIVSPYAYPRPGGANSYIRESYSELRRLGPGGSLSFGDVTVQVGAKPEIATPDIVPPVMATALALWVAIEPTTVEHPVAPFLAEGAAAVRLLAEHPEALLPGLSLVRREHPTAIGPVDLLCRDATGAYVAVEIKRRGEIDGVEQLSRYLELLRREGIDPTGKRAVVVGRSRLVGRPMALLLLQNHATVTIAHSQSTDLQAITRSADILVAATGKNNLITAEYVRPGAVVIDVGITRDPVTNKLTGDVDRASVEPIASALTPVPGGVGPMTIAMLLVNTYRAYRQHLGVP